MPAFLSRFRDQLTRWLESLPLGKALIWLLRSFWSALTWMARGVRQLIFLVALLIIAYEFIEHYDDFAATGKKAVSSVTQSTPAQSVFKPFNVSQETLEVLAANMKVIKWSQGEIYMHPQFWPVPYYPEGQSSYPARREFWVWLIADCDLPNQECGEGTLKKRCLHLFASPVERTPEGKARPAPAIFTDGTSWPPYDKTPQNLNHKYKTVAWPRLVVECRNTDGVRQSIKYFPR